jgi:Mg-chelatase subunit ChlD
MTICTRCGTNNPDTGKFCTNCGATLAPATQALSTSELEARLALFNKLKQRSADIMFVLDCTGSMQGEIDGIKDAIISFADSIKSDGVRARVGLIEFRDRLIHEEHQVSNFNGEIFTSDPVIFRNKVADIKASGGGDEPESSLDAILLALRQPFSNTSSKVIVLITDASPHIPDMETKNIEQVVQAIRISNIQQLYLVIPTQDPKCQVYLKLLEATRGLAFELGQDSDFRERAEDFKRTLMSLGKTISQATR